MVPASDAGDVWDVADVDASGAGAAGGSDKPDKGDEGDAGGAVNVADAGAGFTAVRAGLLRARDGTARGCTEAFAGVAGAAIAPATEGAAGRRRLGVSGDQRAAAERVRTKPAA
jgi:hypothetical protein